MNKDYYHYYYYYYYYSSTAKIKGYDCLFVVIVLNPFKTTRELYTYCHAYTVIAMFLFLDCMLFI